MNYYLFGVHHTPRLIRQGGADFRSKQIGTEIFESRTSIGKQNKNGLFQYGGRYEYIYEQLTRGQHKRIHYTSTKWQLILSMMECKHEANLDCLVSFLYRFQRLADNCSWNFYVPFLAFTPRKMCPLSTGKQINGIYALQNVVLSTEVEE